MSNHYSRLFRWIVRLGKIRFNEFNTFKKTQPSKLRINLKNEYILWVFSWITVFSSKCINDVMTNSFRNQNALLFFTFTEFKAYQIRYILGISEFLFTQIFFNKESKVTWYVFIMPQEKFLMSSVKALDKSLLIIISNLLHIKRLKDSIMISCLSWKSFFNDSLWSFIL